MQNLLTFEKALKENYLPVWNNQLGIEPSSILSKIKKVPVKSDKIVAAAPIGLSGGFGFGKEGQRTPASGNVEFERFVTSTRDMYVNICISAKAVRLTGSGGAMASALDTEIKAAYDAAKWNVGRSLFGNGTGVLTNISSVKSASSGIAALNVSSTKYLKEGLIVDIYNNQKVLAYSGVRIKSINRGGTITLNTGTDTVSGVNGGFITVQNSYNLEIEGLGTIFDDNISTIYGVNKSENPYLYPVVADANGDIDDAIITNALRTAKRDKNSNVNMLLCGDAAYDAYVTYLRVNNVRVEEMSKTLNGGFKAIKFLFGNKEVDIVNEEFVPTNEMWGIDTSAMELHIQDWNFCDLQGGGIFNLMEGQSVYRALLANYGNLICKNPGGCVRIYGCSDTSNTTDIVSGG